MGLSPAVASPALRHSLDIDPAQPGDIFSAFGWNDVAAQPPGGARLDRLGPHRVSPTSMSTWSVAIPLVGS